LAVLDVRQTIAPAAAVHEARTQRPRAEGQHKTDFAKPHAPCFARTRLSAGRRLPASKRSQDFYTSARPKTPKEIIKKRYFSRAF
jgi:hypothetical protein